MSKEEKLKKLLRKSKDYTLEGLKTLLKKFKYELDNTSKTSDLEIRFCKKGNIPIYLYKPHNRKEPLSYQIDDVVKTLKENGE